MNTRLVAIVALSIALAGPARAHQFDVALVAPFSQNSEAGRDILKGLVFAASERDRHSGMTSDGHLGGVDVDFKTVDSSAQTLVAVKAALADLDAPIVFLAAPADWRAALEDDLPGSEIFIPGFPPSESNLARQEVARRFLAATGAEMNGSARIGYNAGRRIDLAVSPLDGVVPAQALRKALKESAGGIDWAADY